MIYFIQCGTNGPIKIGYTDNDVSARMAQLQTGCPYELKLIWVYTGEEYTEAQVHVELSHERVRGEWFHPSENVFLFIRHELSNYHEIITYNGRHIELIESYGMRDDITIRTGIKKGKKFHDIYHDYKSGEMTISTAKNNGVYTELSRIK